jgi:hypothetical protein
MKLLATAALMLNFGVASIYAQSVSVDLTVSGTAANSTVQLTPDIATSGPASEYNLAGGGILDPFTLRVVNSSAANPTSSSTCPSPLVYFAAGAGAGVLRSGDGSLLTLFLTGGGDCIDFTGALPAVCIRTFKITGGTGRFKNASGILTLTMAVVPVLADDTGNPVLFSVTGEVKGTASKVSLWP